MSDDQKQLIDLATGNLKPLALLGLQRRLAQDPALRKELAAVLALTEQLQSTTSTEPSSDLEARILTMRPLLEAPEKPSRPKQKHWWHYRAPIIAISTMSVLIFLAERNKTTKYGTNISEGGPQTMTDLLKWQWVVFLVPLALAVLLALASAVGVGGEHGDHDHDGDGHADHDAAEHENETGEHSSPLALIGVGQAPLSVILICLLVYWAAIGSLGNLALGVGNIGFSVGLALLGSLVATGGTARLIKRYLPTSESFSVGRSELIGREGTAIYPVTEISGTVRLYDQLGTQRQLDCRTMAGSSVIPADTKVIVVDYDRERQVFTVQKWDDLVRTTKED